jgi:mono/diheme cytochrome c family protein
MRSWSAAALAIGVAVALGGAAAAQTPGAPRREPGAERGAQLAQEKCAACHAVALEPRSPERIAPQFRVLSRLYSKQEFTTKLESISANGHFEMPPVAMTEDEIADLASYLASLDGAAAGPGPGAALRLAPGQCPAGSPRRSCAT